MKLSKQQLNHISQELVKNIDELYRYFNIEYIELHKMIRSTCFIHGGDNKSALNFYHKADMAYHFKCRTHNCERTFGKSVISMVRGFLSHKKYGWQKQGDQEVSFPETLEFILQFLSGKVDINFDNSTGYDNKADFNYIVSHLDEEKTEAGKLSRLDVRKQLVIPSYYFMRRGFSSNILDEYDVGDCKDKSCDMKFRAVVPVYDSSYRYIGSTGRSFYEQCTKCSGYHHPRSECMSIPKWKHSLGFNRNLCLYNLNKAKKLINEYHVAVIVESPANVWRLEEAGIHNAVATFGTAIHESQRYLLDENGAMAFVVIMDNDDAGQKAKLNIKENFKKLYGLYFPPIETNDIAEMTIDAVQKTLKPLIENFMEIYK